MRDSLVGVPDSGVVHGEHGGGQFLLGQALVGTSWSWRLAHRWDSLLGSL